MKLHKEELALALELFGESFQWKVIADGLGVHPDTLTKAIRKAKREGLSSFKSYGY